MTGFPFLHIFDDIVWHSLKMQAIRVNQKTADYLTAVRDCLPGCFPPIVNDMDLLTKKGFIVSNEENRKRLEKAKETTASTIQGLYLILTTDCNLNCSYCLYGTESSRSLMSNKRNMSAATVIEAINLYAKLIESNIQTPGYWQQITFYGGEPLLNKSALVSGIEHCNRLKMTGLLWKGTRLVVNTNGILIDQDLAKFFYENEVEVQISIDGFSSVHNKNRFDHSGIGSFDSVLKGFDLLSANNVSIVPLITVTEDNIEYLSELISWLEKNYKISSYGANLLMVSTGQQSETYPKKAADALWTAHKKNNACDFSYLDFFEKLNNGQLSNQSCGAGRKITVFPDGNLHTCQALEAAGLTQWGDLKNIDFGNNNWKEWACRTRFDIQECLECPVLGACSGGCASNSFYSTGDIHGIDRNHCEFAKHLFTKWINEKINLIG